LLSKSLDQRIARVFAYILPCVIVSRRNNLPVSRVLELSQSFLKVSQSELARKKNLSA
jgi:hypothetical protein